MQTYPLVFVLFAEFVLLLTQCSLVAAGNDSSSKPEVNLLVFLPLSEGVLNQTTAWERGPEILPGATLAVDQINNSSVLLQDCTLHLKVVNIDLCIDDTFTSNINAILPFADIAAGVGNATNILGVVGGPFCPEVLRRIVSPLASRESVSLFQISGSTSEYARGTTASNNNRLNFITPSVEVHYEAVYAMMKKFCWKKLFVLSEIFFENATRVRGSDGLNITVRQINSDLKLMFLDLRRSMKKIVFASVGVESAVELLCLAQNESFIYPNYVWLFHDLTPSTLLQHNSFCKTEELQEALQGVFFLRFPFQQRSQKAELVSGDFYSDYYNDYTSRLSGEKLKPNLYANIMYDSVWAFALTLNESLSQSGLLLPDILRTQGKQELVEDMNDVFHNISFEGATGNIDFSDSEVNGIVDFFFDSASIGTYYWASANISLDESIVSKVPSDEIDSRYALIPIPLALILASVVLACLILTTVILSLFIYFRNDADIKATSPHLSYVMFLGCYLLFGSTLLHSLTAAFPIKGIGAVSSVCGIVIVGDSLGVNLIFTTVLLRMLRIYRVFSYFGKTGKLWSDKMMFLIIVLVVMGDIALIVAWSLVDTFRIIEVVIYQPLATLPYYEIRQFCHSDHLSAWLAILLGKLGILFAIVLFLAIKTRKICRSNFKDTKKVNIYIFSTVLVVILPMALYSLLRATNNVLGTYLTVYMVFSLVGLLCQLFLFVPKVSSPILKKYGYQVTYDNNKRRATISKCPSKPTVKRLVLQTRLTTTLSLH